MKSIADYCSKSPISHSDSNAALSIISFTDKPDLIDSELLFRPEKIYSVAFAPLKTEGIKNLLEKETELKEKFFSSLNFISSFFSFDRALPQVLRETTSDKTDTCFSLPLVHILFEISVVSHPDAKYGS